MKVLAATFTIPTEINIGKKTPKKMPFCFSSVVCDQLKRKQKLINLSHMASFFIGENGESKKNSTSFTPIFT